jgi:hypothetical protein
MKTDFNLVSADLVGSVVFRPDFNDHSESLSANQAWSLFFTGGQEDKALGFNPELGRLLTNLLLATTVTGALWALLFSAGA